MVYTLFMEKRLCWFKSNLLHNFAEVAQLVEHDLAKVRVASSSLVFRSKNGKVSLIGKAAVLIPKTKFECIGTKVLCRTSLIRWKSIEINKG